MSGPSGDGGACGGLPKGLSRCAEANGILAAMGRWVPGGDRRFVPQGPWLVRRDLIARLPIAYFASESIPGLAVKRVPGLAAAALRGAGVDLPLEADALQVAAGGDRVRAFDLATARSSKLVVQDSRYGAGTERELYVRQSVLPGTGVGFPPVHEHASDGTYIFLTEQLVQGRRFSPRRDRRLIEAELVEPLMRLAEAQEVRVAPLADVLGASVAWAIRNDQRADPILARARAVVAANPPVATVYGHGDLLPSNIAVSRSGLVLLDWESAGDMLVGYDLLRLWLKYPDVTALETGAARMVASLQTAGLSLADTVALRLAQVLAVSGRPVRAAARRSWQRMV